MFSKLNLIAELIAQLECSPSKVILSNISPSPNLCLPLLIFHFLCSFSFLLFIFINENMQFLFQICSFLSKKEKKNVCTGFVLLISESHIYDSYACIEVDAGDE